MNYNKYTLSWRELGKVLVWTMGLTVLIAWLFYRSAWLVFLFPFLLAHLYKREKVHGCHRQKQKLLEQFVYGIRILNTSVQAGLSMENAWKEVEKETALMYGKEAVFFREVQELNHSVELSIPIEKLLLDFAHRTGMEDIMSFAEVFEYGKRSGGNWKKIIDVTVFRIQEKYDAKKEIQVMVAAKKLEQQVMNVIPLGILLFLQISSWDYMSVLYHNPLGVFCMSVCLLGYGGALWLSEKILKIQV